MREIKFRGKVRTKREWSDTKELVTNNYWNYGDLQTGNAVYIDGFKWRTRVIPETVGQFTGLKDKNGKEIYEGDIVIGDIPELVTEKNLAGVVKYDKSAYFIEFINREPGRIKRAGFCSFENYEIIGNIHDNPELMGVTK